FTRVRLWSLAVDHPPSRRNTVPLQKGREEPFRLVDTDIEFDTNADSLLLWGTGPGGADRNTAAWAFNRSILANPGPVIKLQRAFARHILVPDTHLSALSGNNDDTAVLFDADRQVEIARVTHSSPIVAL